MIPPHRLRRRRAKRDCRRRLVLENVQARLWKRRSARGGPHTQHQAPSSPARPSTLHMCSSPNLFSDTIIVQHCYCCQLRLPSQHRSCYKRSIGDRSVLCSPHLSALPVLTPDRFRIKPMGNTTCQTLEVTCVWRMFNKRS